MARWSKELRNKAKPVGWEERSETQRSHRRRLWVSPKSRLYPAYKGSLRLFRLRQN